MYNEEDSIPLFFQRMGGVEKSLAATCVVDYVLINDGSADNTWALLLETQRAHNNIVLLDLSRRFGKEAALTAGIDFAQGDAVVLIDADLQDPPELIPKMVKLWQDGFEVVVGQRIDRSSDSTAKRLTARWFYTVHNLVAEPRIPRNVGDFRLMDRKVVEALKLLPETRRFMKGLFSWVGFRTASVDYVRPPRVAGKGKFAGWKLWNFAIEGITSFSSVPLVLMGYIGVAVSLGAFFYGAYILLRAAAGGIDLPGYASLFVAIVFLGGLQLVGLGVIGQYLGGAYTETKRRPVYIVREISKDGDGSPRL
jgi:glycosyltransferase involved in cell wall biosynthesis